MSASDPATTSWHLDKRVNVAVIAAITAQALGLVIWGTSLTERVRVVEDTLKTRTPVVERFFQVEADMINLRMATTTRLDRIENKLDRLIENGNSFGPSGR